MDKKTRKLAIIVGAIFGSIIVFNLAKKIIVSFLFAHYTPPAITVSSSVAQKTDYHPYINSVGNFVAVNGVEIGSQIPGIITKIHFKSGQYIKKGKKLVDLDDSVEQADLKLNQSDLSLQEVEFKRQKELQEHNATSLSSLDRARANLQESQARVEKTLALINQKHIKAPFSGFIGIRKVDLGEYIRPGETSIVSLQSLDPIYLKFSIPEHLINKVKLNQSINFSVEQYPNAIFIGKISAINSRSDKNTHNVEIQATIENCPANYISSSIKNSKINIPTVVKCSTLNNKKNKVKNYAFIPGSFASVKIEQSSPKNTILIPSTAISYSIYGDSVFVIEKVTQKNKDKLIVKKVYVTTAGQHDNNTIIKKGLKDGQIIVSSGEFKLQDGNEVAINNQISLPSLNLTKLDR